MCPATGHDDGGVIRCVSIFQVKVADLVRRSKLLFFCGELIALPTPQQPVIRLDDCNLSGRDMAVW